MLPLETFLAGYLSQDVDIVFGTPEEAVRAFTRRSEDEVREARDGILRLLARHPVDDDRLISEAVALGCEYNPPIHGELRRIFLLAVECWGKVAHAHEGCLAARTVDGGRLQAGSSSRGRRGEG